MDATFVLQNKGNKAAVTVTLLISYFTKGKETIQVDTQTFDLTLHPNSDGNIRVDFGEAGLSEREVMVRVQHPEGGIITQQQFRLGDIAGKQERVAFELNEEIDPATQPELPAEPARPAFVYGRLLDKAGIQRLEDVQLIIMVQTEVDGPFEPLTSVRTEAQGYFVLDYPAGVFTQAAAQVGLNLKHNPIPIKLDEQTRIITDPDGDSTVTELVFPRRVILVAELAETPAPDPETNCDCGCEAGHFEQKRVLEEFSFYTLVRTSEPAIKGYVIEEETELTLADILRHLPFTVFDLIEPLRAFPFIARDSPFKTTSLRARSRAAATTDDFLKTIETIRIQKGVLTDFLKDEKTITKDNIGKLFTRNEISSFQTILTGPPAAPRPLGRVELGPDTSIDWDDEPTIYQAVEVAHGHLLHFKSEWIADGYSLGDLLYSLPLAPGQKKQLVVFDWERRESAANSQSVDVEESLSNSLTRDRDILEIARGSVSENLRGSSRASTGGASGAVGGVLGGLVFGVSGGYSTASSRASQDSFRQVSSSDQQRLSDRLVQSANAVRSMRSTVIQTVAQGERFEVSAESVANYNHCHALTIQYYEVLRHFKIRQRFAEARECLFVPLLMSAFDLKKTLRWREALRTGLLDQRLRTGFDAGDRVAHEWQDSNFPSGTYASEPILTAAGELKMRLALQRPLDEIVEVDDTDRPPVFAGSVGFPPVWHKKKVGRIIVANWSKLEKVIGNPAEFYENYLQNVPDKDAVFHQMLGERLARQFVDSLLFTVQDEAGVSIGSVPVDASVSSRYTRNGLLSVTLRITGPTNLPRDRFHYLRIGIDSAKDILSEGSFATVQSGAMRYRTRHFTYALFNYPRLNEDLTATDGVALYAGPTADELKDPRREDLVVVNKLIAHLNDNLEYYHKQIWMNMSEQRRFMLLDGIFLNGKGEGRSVASLVQNELLTIVGNSLVFPVAPGLNLNPDFGMKESLTDFYMTAAADPISVSVPTKGVFAEAVMGKCNSCEKIDESRFWRWEESPIPDSPTAINPISTDTRRADPGSLQAQALPNSLVSIQNVPNAPDPTGLAATMGLLGQAGLFKDITGLTGNQQNAMQTLQTTMEAAKAIAQEAAKLDVQKTMERRLDRTMNAIDTDKSLSPEQKATLKEKALNAYMGGGATATPKPEAAKPTLTDVAVQAAGQGKAVEAKNSDASTGKTEEVKIGSQADGPAVQNAEVWVDIDKLNPSLKRAFSPDVPDTTGITDVEGVVYDAPEGAVYEWSLGTAARGKIEHPDQLKTRIMAGEPGITTLSLDVFDKQKKLLRHTTTHLGVPQFFVVADSFHQYANSETGGRTIASADTFDATLRQLGLTAEKNRIVDKLKQYTESRLIRKTASGALEGHNIRLLWRIGALNDPLPSHLINPNNVPAPTDSDGYANYISINGYPQTGSMLFGLTAVNPTSPTTPVGPKNYNELMLIFTGMFELLTIPTATPTDPVSQDIHDKLTKLLQAFAAAPANQTLKDLVIDVFARFYADVMCHEIYHSLIYHKANAQLEVIDAGYDTQGHTLPPTKDIMNKDRDFLQRTGIDVTDMAAFPAPGSMTIHPFANHSVLSPDNAARIDVFFPIPPTYPFA
ncbi:hypothetical protein FAES_0735 [Fibrella aestuarina BUZ 2]|uniref:Uncharacterized protein n=1 Tax=Fibrella aestuarina BUZ 2 TaxID=1166018 RepID=I0K3P3_9BACT|nr:hypothetical protein [Fibrella aestuarina]CCG98746.1 hypothetical protein FAES_0735 [Fibrella aestuarina BUZ 2]